MKVLNPGDAPFQTSNVVLAFALYQAGVPFAQETIKGKLVVTPLVNQYHADMLREMGYGSLDLESATRKAFADGRKGNVEYGFMRVPELEGLLAVFTDQQKEIEETDESARVLSDRVMHRMFREEITPDEAMLRITCILLKSRVLFVNLWKEISPQVVVTNKGKPKILDEDKETGAKRIRYPGFRIISLNASEKTRKELDL